jgi:hypothetical protein
MVQDKENRYLRERSREKTTVFDLDIRLSEIKIATQVEDCVFSSRNSLTENPDSRQNRQGGHPVPENLQRLAETCPPSFFIVQMLLNFTPRFQT